MSSDLGNPVDSGSQNTPSGGSATNQGTSPLDTFKNTIKTAEKVVPKADPSVNSNPSQSVYEQFVNFATNTNPAQSDAAGSQNKVEDPLEIKDMHALNESAQQETTESIGEIPVASIEQANAQPVIPDTFTITDETNTPIPVVPAVEEKSTEATVSAVEEVMPSGATTVPAEETKPTEPVISPKEKAKPPEAAPVVKEVKQTEASPVASVSVEEPEVEIVPAKEEAKVDDSGLAPEEELAEKIAKDIDKNVKSATKDYLRKLEKKIEEKIGN